MTKNRCAMASEKFWIVQSSFGLILYFIKINILVKFIFRLEIGLIYVNTGHVFLFSSVWLHFVIALTLGEYNIRSLLRFYSKNLNYIAAVSRLYVIFKLYLKRIDLVISFEICIHSKVNRSIRFRVN